MKLMKKDCADQYHPTADGFLSSFKFYDFEFHRMNFCLKKSSPENFQVVLVPAILEDWFEVPAILNFLCSQNLAAIDFDCPCVVFLNHSRNDFPEILHLC